MSQRTSQGRRAERVVRKRLSDGTIKEYRYAPWRPKPPSPRDPPGSVGALLAAYRMSPEWRRLRPSTKATYNVYLRELEEDGGSAMPAAAVTRKYLVDIRNAIAVGRGNGAATGFVRAAKALFGWAEENEYIPFNPAAKVKPLEGGHLPPWSEADFARALAVLDEPYRRIVVLGGYTGLRRVDLARLAWTAYDGQRIRLVQVKTDEPVTVPVHSALKAELDAWRREATGLLILKPPRAERWTVNHMSREMARVTREAGLPRLGVHGLRKLAATRLAEAGCTVHEIAAVLGWRTLSMAQLYTEAANRERLAEAAVLRLERRTTNRTTTR